MSQKFYLSGLDGIRAIACLMVFYAHFNHEAGNLHSSAFSHIDLGAPGVTCFFTLSGFLITTLLLREKTSTSRINLKYFYTRRILRIWPLYFLLLFIGYFISINFVFEGETLSTFLFYTFFIGNVGYSLGKMIWSVNVLWSVGVEEQFYAFWPFVMRAKNIKLSIGLVISLYLLIKLFLYIRAPQSAAYLICERTRIDSMAIGGFIACLRFTGSSLLKPLYSRVVQAFVWVLFIRSFMIPMHVTNFLDNELYSVMIGIIILNVSNAPTTLFSLENPILKYMGKISYGIYVYHIVVITLWERLVPEELYSRIPFTYYTLPFILFSITLLAAHVSYVYFEKFFLVRKENYSIESASPMLEPVGIKLSIYES